MMQRSFFSRLRRLQLSVRDLCLVVLTIAVVLFAYSYLNRWRHTYPPRWFHVNQDHNSQTIEVPQETTFCWIENCSALEKVTIPEGVTTVDISNCRLLKELELPSTMTKLTLSHIDLGVTKVGRLPNGLEELVLYKCRNADRIRAPTSVNIIRRD